MYCDVNIARIEAEFNVGSLIELKFNESAMSGFICEAYEYPWITIYFPRENLKVDNAREFSRIMGRWDWQDLYCAKLDFVLNDKPYKIRLKAISKISTLGSNISEALKGRTAYNPERVVDREIDFDLEPYHKLTYRGKLALETSLTNSFTVIVVLFWRIFRAVITDI